MDRHVLIEYTDMKEEIEDIRRRIRKLRKSIDNLTEVCDSVTGTRPDGTIGNIRISGYPMPEYCRKKELIEKNQKKLELKELELLDLTNKVEVFVESIQKSELRIIFRLYYLDNLTWVQVAHRMNQMFPKRRIKYTEDSCRKKKERFFSNVRPCPEEK